MSIQTQSFFLPEPFFCMQTSVLAECYNLANTLLNRSQSEHIFVPIRNLQYLGIIEKDVFWFVDSMAYATQGDEGGRLITVSWHPTLKAAERDSLSQHMPCKVTFYRQGMSEIQKRLPYEFNAAMKLLDSRYRDQHIPESGAKILPFRPNEPQTSED